MTERMPHNEPGMTERTLPSDVSPRGHERKDEPVPCARNGKRFRAVCLPRNTAVPVRRFPVHSEGEQQRALPRRLHRITSRADNGFVFPQCVLRAVKRAGVNCSVTSLPPYSSPTA